MEKQKLINHIKSLYNEKGERWVLVKNRSGMLEMIPEMSLEGLELTVKLIFKIDKK